MTSAQIHQQIFFRQLVADDCFRSQSSCFNRLLEHDELLHSPEGPKTETNEAKTWKLEPTSTKQETTLHPCGNQGKENEHSPDSGWVPADGGRGCFVTVTLNFSLVFNKKCYSSVVKFRLLLRKLPENTISGPKLKPKYVQVCSRCRGLLFGLESLDSSQEAVLHHLVCIY